MTAPASSTKVNSGQGPQYEPMIKRGLETSDIEQAIERVRIWRHRYLTLLVEMGGVESQVDADAWDIIKAIHLQHPPAPSPGPIAHTPDGYWDNAGQHHPGPSVEDERELLDARVKAMTEEKALEWLADCRASATASIHEGPRPVAYEVMEEWFRRRLINPAPLPAEVPNDKAVDEAVCTRVGCGGCLGPRGGKLCPLMRPSFPGAEGAIDVLREGLLGRPFRPISDEESAALAVIKATLEKAAPPAPYCEMCHGTGEIDGPLEGQRIPCLDCSTPGPHKGVGPRYDPDCDCEACHREKVAEMSKSVPSPAEVPDKDVEEATR